MSDFFNDVPNPPEKPEVKDLNPELSGDKLSIGMGAIAMKSDERGTWWGADSPEQASVFIEMSGTIHIRSSSEGGGQMIWYEDGIPRMILGFE